MAGGRRIDDHSVWVGAKPKGSVFPEGAKMKSISDVEGSGALMDYYDTESKIADVQKEQVRKVERHETKPGYRN